MTELSHLSKTSFSKAITTADFEKEVLIKSQQVPVLVDFWADWCAPCKQLMPVLHNLVDSLAGQVLLATVNTDEEQELTMQMGIRSLPTVVLFKNGEMVEQFSGVKSESEIKNLLTPHLHLLTNNESNSDESKLTTVSLHKAIELFNQGRVQDAISALQNDQSFNAKLLLIKLYLHDRQVENATKAYDQFDDEQKQNEQAKIIKITLDLFDIGHKSKNEALQNAIESCLTNDPVEGVDKLLSVLSVSKDSDKDETKKALIVAFNLIDDSKMVSQFRRKMASLIF